MTQNPLDLEARAGYPRSSTLTGTLRAGPKLLRPAGRVRLGTDPSSSGAGEDAFGVQVSQAGPPDSFVRLGDGPVHSQGQAVVPGEPLFRLRQQLGLELAFVLADVVDVVGLEPQAQAAGEPPGEQSPLADVHGELEIDDMRAAVAVHEDIARLVEVEVHDIPRVDLPDGGQEMVEEVRPQGRPVAEARPFNVLVDIHVRTRPGQDCGDFADSLAAAQTPDLDMGHEPAQPTQRNQTKVHLPADLADQPGGQTRLCDRPFVQGRSSQEIVLEDFLKIVPAPKTANLRWDAFHSAGIEAPAKPAGRPRSKGSHGPFFGRSRHPAINIITADISRRSLVHLQGFPHRILPVLLAQSYGPSGGGSSFGQLAEADKWRHAGRLSRMLPTDSGFCLRTPPVFGGTPVSFVPYGGTQWSLVPRYP